MASLFIQPKTSNHQVVLSSRLQTINTQSRFKPLAFDHRYQVQNDTRHQYSRLRSLTQPRRLQNQSTQAFAYYNSISTHRTCSSSSILIPSLWFYSTQNINTDLQGFDYWLQNHQSTTPIDSNKPIPTLWFPVHVPISKHSRYTIKPIERRTSVELSFDYHHRNQFRFQLQTVSVEFDYWSQFVRPKKNSKHHQTNKHQSKWISRLLSSSTQSTKKHVNIDTYSTQIEFQFYQFWLLTLLNQSLKSENAR